MKHIYSDDQDQHEKWEIFKQNQYAYSVDYDRSMIQTDDLTGYADFIHLDHISQNIIGERFFVGMKDV